MGELPIRPSRVGLVVLLSLLCTQFFLVEGTCELSVLQGRTLYNYSLTSPTAANPHGALSEDGFYKIGINETSLWFQICDQMIFNHDPPTCFTCEDCGGTSHCGMKCSALVSNNIGDSKNPRKGVTLKMSASSSKNNCSLSVSVLCDMKANGPESMELLGDCHYATVLRHPSGCPKVVSISGKGWGWFASLLIIILCLWGVYLSAGIIYRFFFLGIRGPEVIPNVEFWFSIPQRLQMFLGSLVRRLRGPHRGSTSSYSPMSY